MARRSTRKQAAAHSSSEEDFSGSSASEDEEKRVGRDKKQNSKRASKPTMYRSLPSGAGQGQSRRSAAPPSDSEEEYSSDGAAQEKAAPTRAPAAVSRPQQQEERSSNTKWYLLGGLLVLLLIAGGIGLWWYNKSESSTSDADSSAQNSTASANSTSLSVVKPSSTSSLAGLSGASSDYPSATGLHNSSSSTNSTSAGGESEPSKTGAATFHDPDAESATKTSAAHVSEASDPGTLTGDNPPSTTWVPSLTAAEPEQTKPTAGPAATQTTKATFFVSDNGVSPCLSRPNDGDFVVHVSPQFYGDVGAVSKRCGKWVSMWNEKTNYTVTASIEGVCADCKDYELDLSQAAFYGLTWDMDIGEIQIQWWWTDTDRRPTPSVTTLAANQPAATQAAAFPVQTVEPVSFSAQQPKWMKATALWFSATGGQGACKSWNGDQDFVVGLPAAVYGDAGSASSLCGAEVLVKDPGSGKTVKARVADTSGSEYLTLSLAAFATLASPEIGMLSVQYYFTDSSVKRPSGVGSGVQDPKPKEEEKEKEKEKEQAQQKQLSASPTPAPEQKSKDDPSKASADAAWASSSSAAAAARASKEAKAAAEKSAADASWAASSSKAAENHNPGHCGTVAEEYDKVIALPSAMYANGAHCGKQIRLTRTDNGRSVVATVRDSCPTCVNNESLDLSVGAFTASASESEGMVPISWTWV